MRSREDIAKQIRPALGQLGELPAGFARLGFGDGSGRIVADFSKRLVYYFGSGQSTAAAPLARSESIVAYNNPSLEGMRVRLGYPNYDPTRLHIMGIDSGEGLDAVGGITPQEQLASGSLYPDVGRIINLRLAPNSPNDSSVFVNAGWYWNADGDPAWFGGDTFDLAADIAALDGEHQMAVICLDLASGELKRVLSAAEAGDDDSKTLLDATTAEDLSYGAADLPVGIVHLYDGQTAVVEADIYRDIDPRVLFTRPGAGGGSDDVALHIALRW